MLERIARAGLVLVVAALAVLVLANYWIASRQFQRGLETQLDQQLNQLATSLDNPLWSFDQQTVQLICEAFMAGADVASMEVMQKAGARMETVFHNTKPETGEVISGTVPVLHEGQVIGHVSIGLSGQVQKAALKRLLFSGAGVALVILGSAFLFMKSLLTRHLTLPLRALGAWTEQVARGDYGPTGQQIADEITEEELRPIVAKFSEMSQQVAAREHSLRESEKKFRDLADLLPGIVFETDPLGKIRFLSSEGLNILGYRAEDLNAGLTLAQLAAPRHRTRLARNLEQTVQSGGQEGLELSIARSDGDQFPALAFISRIQDGGKVVGLRGIALDITRQKELERQVAQSSKLEAIGTLAGGIAHDFNNILSAIIGYVELTLENRALKDEDQQNIEAVHTAGLRAKDLVRQILMFGRKDEDQKDSVQIHLVVEEALSLVGKTMPASIRIVRDIDRQTGHVTANATRIHQIVMNLCTNAYHALPQEGGTLEVGLRAVQVDSETTLRQGRLEKGGYALLTVRDTGSGMEPDLLDKIFDPFFTTKNPGKGTGMGLSVVHGIVMSHGGALDVATEVGKGTTFSIYLPLISIKAPGENGAEEKVTPGGDERILYVDDDSQLAVLGRRLLTAIGYQVTEVTSSVRALAMFKAAPGAYDMIITDQTMPDLSGSQLAAEALQTRPDIPIIICTGYSEVLDRQEVLDLGVKAVLNKPLNMKQLSRVIRDSLTGESSPA
jgi:PAS domain S-box-containing protein